MNDKALKMIHDALRPLMRTGSKIEINRMKLMVCPTSRMAELEYIDTAYGRLRIAPGEYIPKGVSYLMEDPGRAGRAFAWVSRKEPITQGGKDYAS